MFPVKFWTLKYIFPNQEIYFCLNNKRLSGFENARLLLEIINKALKVKKRNKNKIILILMDLIELRVLENLWQFYLHPNSYARHL